MPKALTTLTPTPTLFILGRRQRHNGHRVQPRPSFRGVQPTESTELPPEPWSASFATQILSTRADNRTIEALAGLGSMWPCGHGPFHVTGGVTLKISVSGIYFSLADNSFPSSPTMTVIPSYVRYIGITTVALLLGQVVGLSNSYTPYLIALNMGLLTTLLTTTYLFPSMLPELSTEVEEEEKTPNNRQALRAKERKETKDKKKEKNRKE
ncbi:hypothetical protein BC937DRAFT_92267 [Endogone sp. FLAS-F59071]|nr:hypothetical protein BC937DRAFT_92267 [Endogone sp. FLAS-F59071]|eukprot:RUS21561.1 hypothetical protein BC937DRAFT_92267 [Endogone sp. FLAS-F59071]